MRWMRNMVLAHELGRAQEKASRCIVAYAAGGGFPTEAKAVNLDWLASLASDAEPPLLISYQDIAFLAAKADPDPVWSELSHWIAGKVATALRPDGTGKITAGRSPDA